MRYSPLKATTGIVLDSTYLELAYPSPPMLTINYTSLYAFGILSIPVLEFELPLLECASNFILVCSIKIKSRIKKINLHHQSVMPFNLLGTNNR